MMERLHKAKERKKWGEHMKAQAQIEAKEREHKHKNKRVETRKFLNMVATRMGRELKLNSHPQFKLNVDFLAHPP